MTSLYSFIEGTVEGKPFLIAGCTLIEGRRPGSVLVYVPNEMKSARKVGEHILGFRNRLLCSATSGSIMIQK